MENVCSLRAFVTCFNFWGFPSAFIITRWKAHIIIYKAKWTETSKFTEHFHTTLTLKLLQVKRRSFPFLTLAQTLISSRCTTSGKWKFFFQPTYAELLPNSRTYTLLNYTCTCTIRTNSRLILGPSHTALYYTHIYISINSPSRFIITFSSL
jgi:hypothetical protein